MEKNKKDMKIIANVIYWFAQVAKVFSMIAVVVIVAIAISVPFIVKQVGDITNDTINYGNKTLKYELTENSIIFDETEMVLTGDNIITIREVRNIFRDNNTIIRVLFIESFLVAGIVLLALAYIMFISLTKLFKNIGDGDTPFTKDNIFLLRKIGKYMIIISVLPLIIDIVIKTIFRVDYVFGFNGIDVMYILVIFALGYIFEYGYQLQEDVDGIL